MKQSSAVPMQDESLAIWQSKYQLKSRSGEPIDESIADTYSRVARALADVESANEQAYWYQKFLWAMNNGAIPAGRVISNAGSEDHKPETSTINCTVAGTIEDSMKDILSKVNEAGLTLKAGCGIGYDFSTMRPAGAFVKGSGSYTSGPLSFMDIYDKMCFTISSAGGRRGAQMATFDVGHPDVMEFIKAKREDGRLRQFNMSLLITRKFIEAVENDGDWHLIFPLSKSEIRDTGIDLADESKVIWRRWPTTANYTVNEQGRVACRIYKTIKAREIWDAIMESTYDFAEPGFILIDNINEMNNNWFCENIRATNPCGEQPLPPHGSCLLGSINLTHFVTNPFTPKAAFDWKLFSRVVAIFTRMLDNVVEINGLPLKRQVEEIERKRRHGMGFLGLGSTMAMLRMKYGSAESVDFTYEVSKELALAGWNAGVELSKEKGAAPIMNEDFTVTDAMLFRRPEMVEDGYKAGDVVKGKVLLAKYSRYMQRLGVYDPQLIEKVAKYGARFTHHTSIAPTGTISLSLANNASNGIEPSFDHHYTRNVIREGRKTKESVDVYSYEMWVWRNLHGDQTPPDYFTTTEDITPNAHIDIQAAAQWFMDSSISKTINIPTDFPFGQFKVVYLRAAKMGLKGCTTFRFNPEAFQGVLVKQKDLEATEYDFEAPDGTRIQGKGGDVVEYDGERMTIANLHDAVKEGYYGKLCTTCSV